MENQKPETSSGEIDLGQLFSKIGDFFRNLGMGLVRFLALIRRIPLENRVAFLLIITASVAGGISYTNLLKRNYYESTMILSSDYLNKRLVDNAMEKLNLLAGESNRKGLAKVLTISDTLAKNILGFRAKPFVAETDLIEMEVLKEQLKNANTKNDKVINQVVSRIEIENRHAFEITVITLNPTVITELQTALVNYFRNNDYIKKRIEIGKLNLNEKKKKLDADLQKLDSLKFVIYDNYRTMAGQSRQGSNNVILSDKPVTNPVEIYKQDIELYDQLQLVKRSIYLEQDFEIVDGFTEFSEPAGASSFRIILNSILIGIVLGYLSFGLIYLNKYLSAIS